jgi:hypothetical protein
MTDNFDFSVQVSIYDKQHMQFEERGNELKLECVSAIEKLLEEKGYRKYRDEYFVCTIG